MADFKKLREQIKSKAQEAPLTAFEDVGNGNIPAEQPNAATGDLDALAAKYEKMQEPTPDKLADLSPLQAGRLLQEKIMRGECSIWAIFHAMKRQAPPEEIALIAVKGLALVTSDPMVYKTVAEAYRAKYGITLEEKPPYKISYCKSGQ